MARGHIDPEGGITVIEPLQLRDGAEGCGDWNSAARRDLGADDHGAAHCREEYPVALASRKRHRLHQPREDKRNDGGTETQRSVDKSLVRQWDTLGLR
jgi:hypothetical protein